MRKTIAIAAIAVLAAVAAPSAAEARQRQCFPVTATMRLTAVVPVVPGYCLTSHHASKPEPGTITRGVVTYKGKSATVRIYRAGAWHTYRYAAKR